MKKINITTLLRPHLKELKPYSSARDEYTGKKGVFLDANENPYKAVGIDGAHNRYPDPYQALVKEKVSKIKKVPLANIFLGNGSDEPIDLLIRAFCEPDKDEILVLPPTYGMYSVSAGINNVSLRAVPLTPEFDIDEHAVLDAITGRQQKIIFLCSPNNPTGNTFSHAKIKKVLDDFDGIVVLDEAYIDYSSQPSYLALLSEYENLVVLQTFSKAWGLAGLRVGVAYASAEIISVLNKIKPPYNINSLTQEAMLKCLDCEADKNALVEATLKERELLKKRLEEIPSVLHIYPSDANFLLVKTTKPNEIYKFLLESLIILRNRSSVLLCEGCLRVTVGTPKENDKLIEAWQKF